MNELNQLRTDYANLKREMESSNLNLMMPDVSSFGTDINAIRENIEQYRDALEESKNYYSDINGILNSILISSTKGLSATNQAKKSISDITSLNEKILKHNQGIEVLNLKQLTHARDKARAEIDSLSMTAIKLKQSEEEILNGRLSSELQGRELTSYINNITQQTLIKELKDQELEIVKNINDEYENGRVFIDDINKGLALGNVSLNSFEGVLNKVGLRSISSTLGFDQAKVDMKELAEDIASSRRAEGKNTTFGDSISVLSKGLSSLNFNAGLLSGAAILFNIMMGVDKRVGDTAKNMNISYKEALKLDSTLTNMSVNTDDIFVTTKGLSETLNAVNSSMGTSAMIGEEHLKTYTKLRVQAGLTNEEIKGMSDLSFANNNSLKQNTDEFLKQSELTSKTMGVSINSKEVMKGVKDISAATTISYAKNPKLIAEAVTTAKALGMEMSKIDGMMNSMLDFETSINSELEAELLIGKNINLENARWASLNNDIAGFAKEINSQIGSSADFSNMNRIQQEALGKAVGMNREELAKTLYVQEQLAGISGQDAAAKKKAFEARVNEIGLDRAKAEMGKGGLDNLLNQASIQDKMTQSLESFKEIMVQIAQLVLPIVSPFADLVGYLSKSKVAMVGIQAVLGGMLGRSIGIAMAQMIGASSMAGPIGLAAGLVGAAALPALINSKSQQVKDGIAPSSKGPFTITDNYGATAVTASGDHLVVSPNVSRKDQQNTTSNIINNSAQVDMSETNRLLSSLLKKNGNVMIDSTQMGTAVSMNTYSIQ